MRWNRAKIRSVGAIALLFVFVALILIIKIKTAFNFYDEGFAVLGATRILNGDGPYKDFWAIYPPGQFYAIAAVFKAFGNDLMVSRIFDIILRFLMVVAVYLLARRVTTRILAALTGLVVALLLGWAGFYSYAIFPAIELGLWAILCWFAFSDSGKKRWLFLAGILIGVDTIIRWDVGIYAALSLVAGAYLSLLAGGGKLSLKAIFAPLKVMVWVLGPMIVVGGLGYGLIALRSGFSNLFDQVFYFPTVVLHTVRWLPYPSLIPGQLSLGYLEEWSRFYMPILTLGVAIVYFLYTYWKKRSSLNPANPDQASHNQANLGTAFFGTIILACYAALLFNQALSRYDYIHVLPSSIVTYLVAAALVFQSSTNFKNKVIRTIPVVLLVGLSLLYILPATKDLLATLDYARPTRCFSRLERASCVQVNPDQEKAVEFIRANTQENEPIFVGNQRHDRIFVNDIGFYYLAGRPPATRYHELYPSVGTTLEVQQTVVKELENKNVKWIVLVKIDYAETVNDSSKSSGIHFLDDYIQLNYAFVKDFGIYRIMKLINVQ